MTSKIKSYAHYQATATTIFHSSSITPKTHLEKLHLYFENFHSRKFIWRYHQQPFVGRLMSSLSEIAEIILMSNSFYKAPEYTQGNQVHITLNSLVPGRFEKRFRWVIFNLNDKSTLVEVMVWCYQATSHYLSPCWTGSMLPYGFTKPQWFNNPLDIVIKMPFQYTYTLYHLTTHRKPHWHETNVWPFYLHNGISYAGRTANSYWNRASWLFKYPRRHKIRFCKVSKSWD